MYQTNFFCLIRVRFSQEQQKYIKENNACFGVGHSIAEPSPCEQYLYKNSFSDNMKLKVSFQLFISPESYLRTCLIKKNLNVFSRIYGHLAHP